MTLVSLGSSGPWLTAAGEIELDYFCPTVRSRQCSRSLISPTKNFSGLYYRLRLFLTLLLFHCPSIGVRPAAQSKGYPASSCIFCFFCFTSISPQYQCLQCGRPGFNPWVRKIPWRRKWQPTPVLLPGKSHGWRSLVGYSPWGHKESDTTEWLHFSSWALTDTWVLLEQLLSVIQERKKAEGKAACGAVPVEGSSDFTGSSGPGRTLQGSPILRQEGSLSCPPPLSHWIKAATRKGRDLGWISSCWLRESPRERLSCEPLATDTPGAWGKKCIFPQGDNVGSTELLHQRGNWNLLFWLQDNGNHFCSLCKGTLSHFIKLYG